MLKSFSWNLPAVCSLIFQSLVWSSLISSHHHAIKVSSVQSLSRVQLFSTPWTAACQASLSITNSWSLPKQCPVSRWCHPTISSSVVPFSSCLQSFPTSWSFLMSWLFTSGGQSIGASASASVLPMNSQHWFISFRMDWFDLFVVQGALKSLNHCKTSTWSRSNHALL